MIKFFRKEKGLTVKKLSEISGVAVGYLSDLENNKSNNPTKEVMENIAAALGQTVPEIFYP
ncbi:helix-turn-helix domain-containing protein [Haloimpatiens massiliensis]|uniref:helix-turn-helix domain-containing protein n=1 Tax=Haloimpatiens massiliensis TaxID=1658110 RepID=UPI001FA83EBB|nr:helix-turn-helix transcriptional regulator [Haloimpatiens massiliensis]